jgi:hypothetical protein
MQGGGVLIDFGVENIHPSFALHDVVNPAANAIHCIHPALLNEGEDSVVSSPSAKPGENLLHSELESHPVHVLIELYDAAHSIGQVTPLPRH